MEHHAQLLNLLYLAPHHVLGQTVLRYAEHEHAAWLGLHLEHLDVEAHAGQVAGYGEPGGPRTDDGHAAAGLGLQLLAYQTHVAIEVGDEALQLAHMYALALLGEHTVAFTLLLVGAHAPANGRKVALVVDYLHRIAEVSLRYLIYPVGNILTDGTALAARRHLAVKATLGLVDSLKDGITLVDLVEKVSLFVFFLHVV